MPIARDSEDRKDQRKQKSLNSEEKIQNQMHLYLCTTFFLSIFWVVRDGAIDWIVFFQNAYLESLTPKWWYSEAGLWEGIRLGGWAPQDKITASEETLEGAVLSHHHVKTQWTGSQKESPCHKLSHLIPWCQTSQTSEGWKTVYLIQPTLFLLFSYGSSCRWRWLRGPNSYIYFQTPPRSDVQWVDFHFVLRLFISSNH